jgi:hypothetical protein
MEYLVIFEETDKSVGAYVAIELHIESLRDHGEPVPQPHSSVEVIAV